MYESVIRRNIAISFIATLILLLGKFAAGYASNSMALVYDGLESSADLIIFLSLYGASVLAAKPPDREHLYGHTKVENLASLLLGLGIAVSGVFFGINALERLLKHEAVVLPHQASFYAALSVVAIKEFLYIFTKNQARLVNSPILEALAVDHHKDALSSVVTVIGTTGSFFKAGWLDPLAALVTSGVIFFMGIKTFYTSSSDLLDKSPDAGTVRKIENAILSVEGVKKISELKARKSGKDIYVDVSIEVDAEMSVKRAHEIASSVQERTVSEVKEVKSVIVHVEPHGKQ